MAFKKKIRRQLKSILTPDEIDRLSNSQLELLKIKPDELLKLLGKVESAYDEYEDRLNVSYRNLKISSEEVDRQSKKVRSLKESLENILESLSEGLLAFNSEGKIAPPYSKILGKFLIAKLMGLIFLMLLIYPVMIETRHKCGLILPLKIKLNFESINELGPKTYVSPDDRHFSLSYNPIYHGGDIQAVTLVVKDRTSEHLAHLESLKQQKRARIVDNILKARNDFNMFMSYTLDFLKDWGAISNIDEIKFKELRMVLHTIKGSCGYFGIEDLVEIIQKHEESFAELDLGKRNFQEIQTLALACVRDCEKWMQTFTKEFATLCDEGITSKDQKYISRTELVKSIDRSLKNKFDRDQWILEIVGDPIEEALHCLKSIAEATAFKLNKKIKPVSIKCENFKIINSVYRDLMSSFSHLVRNAIDHGIEEAEDRVRLGKDAEGSLEIDVKIEKQDKGNKEYINFVFKDDGRGFDFDILKSKLEKEGVYQVSDQLSLIRQASQHGISSKAKISNISGCGIGMSAVFKEVENLEGNIRISSEKNVGTTITIKVPRCLLPEEYQVPDKISVAS